MKRRIITVFFLGVASLATLNLSKSQIFSDYTKISAVSSAHANSSKQIYGQIHYDQTNLIPDQASLIVQLIEQDKNGAEKVISQIHSTPDPSGETAFQLPIHVDELKSQYKYSLKARISIGDSLIYVSEKPTMVDTQQSGYIMRLASIGQGKQETSQSKGLIGSKWVAREIDNVPIIVGSNISLTLDKEQTAILGLNNSSAATNQYNVSGSDGCDHFFSSAAINETIQSLMFNPLDMTYIKCSDMMEQQKNLFINMISKVHSYVIDKDNNLNFKDKNNQTIARFIAE